MKAHYLLILTFFLQPRIEDKNLLILTFFLQPRIEDKNIGLKFKLTNQLMIFSVLIIKALLIKKLVKKIHSFSSSFKVIDFIPDFFSLFNCIRTLYFFAKLVTISFFLRGILGNALSALLMERFVEASVSSLAGVGES